MTGEEMARSYGRTAGLILQEAEHALQQQAWHLAVRRAQESVEMALKAALRLVGIEIPRLHDVGTLLRAEQERFPAWFQADVDRLASISRGLRRDRELSFYGDEDLGQPPEQIFSRYDGEQAVAQARSVLEQCRRLMVEYGDDNEA